MIEGEDIVPIAFRGQLASKTDDAVEFPVTKMVGVTGHVARTGESVLLENAAECEFAVLVPGTHEIEESMIDLAVPVM